MKNPRKFLIRHLLRALLLLFCLTAFLLSPPGLRILTPLLESKLSETLAADVKLEGLQLRLPLTLRLESLSVLNAEDDGVRMGDLELRLSLRALTRGRIHIRRLHLEDLRLSHLRFGSGTEAESNPADEPFSFPDWEDLFRLARVDSLRVRSLQLLPPLVAEKMDFAVSGELTKQFLRSEIEMEALPNFGKARVQFSAMPGGGRLRWKLDGRGDAGEMNLQGSLDSFTTRAELQGQLRVAGLLADAAVAELNLTLHPGGVDLELVLSELPLSAFGLRGITHPDARVRGSFRMEGRLNDPVGSLELDFQGLRPESAELWDGPPARFLVQSHLREGRLKSEFRVENLPGDPVELKLDLPVRVSVYPHHLHIPPEEPVYGSFRANTDLQGLARLAVLDVYHRFSGALVAEAQLNGTITAPRLDGKAALRDGRYEHELLGLLLRNVELSLSARRDGLVLDHLRASDGGGGRLELTGVLGLKPAERFPFELNLGVRDFRLINHDLADVTARGDLQWKGTRGESHLTGGLRLNPVELRIPEHLPSALIPLEVVEIHEVAPEAVPEAAAPERRHLIHFDLSLDAPDRVFVRGRGLESEWSARLRLQGDSRDPQLVGLLDVLRGRFVFFGKRLLLTRGRVQFDGVFPPEPNLDVAAELRGGGILAILQVRGPAADPEIILSSSPMLPEDEILARLLFGRESARITPWQALTLAQALNRLRGGGSAFDLLGETRRILRVDQVEVRSDEEEGDTSITLGKYISDRIYVEVERGIGTEGGRARVEVELTPELRLETETGGQTDTGVGIIWTRDF